MITIKAGRDKHKHLALGFAPAEKDVPIKSACGLSFKRDSVQKGTDDDQWCAYCEEFSKRAAGSDFVRDGWDEYRHTDSEDRFHGPLNAVAIVSDDDCPDLSYLGELSDNVKKGEAAYIDLRSGGIFDPDGTFIKKVDPFWDWDQSMVRYFKFGPNHLPHKPGNWGHCEDKWPEVIEKHGSLREADIAYAIEDLRRALNYGYSWFSVIVTVEMADGKLRSSLGGIEISMILQPDEKKYVKEVFDELFWGLLLGD
jgi:hypothetical protein